MLVIQNSLNAHNFPIFHPILIIFVSKFMVHRVLFDKTCLSLGLPSPIREPIATCGFPDGGGGGAQQHLRFWY